VKTKRFLKSAKSFLKLIEELLPFQIKSVPKQYSFLFLK